MEERYWIYKITCLANNRVYIGKTKQDPPTKRWLSHLQVMRGGPETYPDKYYYIHAAMKKHGEENFTYEIIDECIGQEESCELEISYIEEYKANTVKYGKKYGYNLTAGGEGALESPRSEETRKKISDSLKGRFVGTKNPRFGKPLPKEQRDKISKANIGRKMSDESIAKRKRTLIEHGDPRKGRKLTDEARIHVLAGIKRGPEHAQYNKPMSLEQRQKLSVAKRKAPSSFTHNEETISKIRGSRAEQDMTFRIPVEVKKQVIELFDSGDYTKRDLASAFGLKPNTIRSILKRRTYIVKPTIEVVLRMVELFEQGLSLDTIAKEVHVDRRRIASLIYNHYETNRPIHQVRRGSEVSEETVAKMVDDYLNQDVDGKEICIRYGVSLAVFKGLMKSKGVRRKP